MDRANPPVMPGPELAGTELLGLLGLLESLLGLCSAACCLAGGMAHIVASPAWVSVAGCGRRSSFNSDWNVCQIDRLVVHQIELRARLGQRAVRLHAWARLADWVLFQIGQIGVRTRLPDRRFRQIVVLFWPNFCQSFAQAGCPIEFDARLPSVVFFSL